MPLSVPREVHRKADNVAGIRKSENINGRYRVRFEGETRDTWILYQDLVETHTEVPVPTAKAPEYTVVKSKNMFVENLQKGLQDRQKNYTNNKPVTVIKEDNLQGLPKQSVDVEQGIEASSSNMKSKQNEASSSNIEPEQYANNTSTNEPSPLDSPQSLQLLTPPTSPLKETTISKEDEELYHRIIDESIEAHFKRKMYQVLSPVLYIFSGMIQAMLLLLTILNVVWYYVRVYIICVGVSAIIGGHSQNMTSFYQYCNQTLHYTVNQTLEFHKQLSITEHAPNFCMINQTGISCVHRDLEILHQNEEIDIDIRPMLFMSGSYTLNGLYEEANHMLFKYDVPSYEVDYPIVQGGEQYWPYLISLYMNPLTNPLMLFIPLYGERSRYG